VPVIKKTYPGKEANMSDLGEVIVNTIHDTVIEAGANILEAILGSDNSDSNDSSSDDDD
jgi:hypothetical protein